MARSAVTVASLTAYNSEGTVTKDAIDATNNHSIDVSGVKDGNLLVFIETTNTEAGTFEIKAGDFSGAGVGDVTITTGSALTQVIQLESSRFKDEDELILIDVTGASVTGNIYAVEGN